MSLLDRIFNPQPQQAPANTATPGAPANPGNMPPAATVSTADAGSAPNGTVPNPMDTGAMPSDDSPLAQYKELWDTAPIDSNAPSPASTAPQLTQENVSKVVGNVDFTKSVTPEALAAISAGGQEAVAALASVINAVGQQSLTQATLVSNKLAEQQLERALEAHDARLPELIRSSNVTSHLADTNPLFSNPAIKPVIEATQSQLQAKFPNATPAEITKMTGDYIRTMGEAFAPAPVVTSGTGEANWDKYIQ